MARRTLGIIVLILGLVSATGSATAQADTDRQKSITYGETVDGQINNATFEQLYTFEGEQGDIIVISMTAAPTSDLDGYLYLTTPQNDLIAEDDDSDGSNPRIITQLDRTGTYQIIATRYQQRVGSSQGSYSLRVDVLENTPLDRVIVGRIEAGQPAPFFPFQPEAVGDYTLVYDHQEGDLYPDVVIYEVDLASSYYYQSEVASMRAEQLRGGRMSLELEPGFLYIIAVQQDFYYYYDDNVDGFGDFALQIIAGVDPALVPNTSE